MITGLHVKFDLPLFDLSHECVLILPVKDFELLQLFLPPNSETVFLLFLNLLLPDLQFFGLELGGLERLRSCQLVIPHFNDTRHSPLEIG